MECGKRWRGDSRIASTSWALAAGLLGLLPGAPVLAAVFDTAVTDVTPSAFAVVWVSNEPVTAATLRVFSDAQGSNEVTGTLSVELTSAAVPTAHDLGIVKVNVKGLAADTPVFIQTQTTGSGGTVLFPPAPPLLEVRTAVATAKVDGSQQLIVNDLVRHGMFRPDGTTSAPGALLLVQVPGLGRDPLTAFAGVGFGPQTAAVDLNELYDTATDVSALVPAGQILILTELRGLLCPGLAGHRLVRFRRAPAHEEIGVIGVPITEIETPVRCFFADTVCDDTVNILDAQRVLNVFGRASGDCAFNPDLDIVVDHVINILDVQSVLNRFGQSAPFPP